MEVLDPPGVALDAADLEDEVLWEQRGLMHVPAAESGRWLVEAALAAEPGPVMAGVVAGLDPATLDGDSRVDLIRVWQRVAAWVDAQQQMALAAVVAATEDCGLEGDFARHEVGVALRLSPGSAYDKVQRAQALAGPLADTLAALLRGEITGSQATAIAEAVEHLDPEVTATVQARVLATAPEQTLAETKRALRRAVIAADPAGAAARAEAARADRAVTRSALDDGMAELRAVLSATDTELIWRELTARAQATKDRLARAGQDTPGLDALRADALVAAIFGRHDNEVGKPGLPSEAPTRVQLQVTIDLPTLLGLAQNPADLPGHGPIPPHLARELAGDADWIRFTTDPQTGQLLDLGRRSYRPSRRLAAFIRARESHCQWPGCSQPAHRCDLDHTTDYHAGGPTSRHNLGPLCRQHHNAKTHGQWHYRRDPDGTAHLTSPLGQTHTIRPPWRRADQ